MNKISFLLFFLALFTLTGCYSPKTTPGDQGRFLSTNGWPVLAGNQGDTLWIAADYSQKKPKYTVSHWLAARDILVQLRFPKDFILSLATPIGDGWVLIGSLHYDPKRKGSGQVIHWLAANGDLVSATLPEEHGTKRLLALNDHSVLMADKTNGFTHVIKQGSRLQLTQLPNLPGPERRDYALVTLPSGEVMAMGGTSYRYVGCEPSTCEASTYLLDVAAQRWRAGPPLLRPRANASATTLPDGSVLIAGGWSPGHSWQESANTSSERWRPGEPKFSEAAPLPQGVAMQYDLWIQETPRRHWLLAGGMSKAWQGNDAVMAYDVTLDAWRTVGEGCAGDNKNGKVSVTMAQLSPAPVLACKGVEYDARWQRSPLRLPGERAYAVLDLEAGWATHRANPIFLPSDGTQPALVIGGISSNGANAASVDAIWPDGRVQTLAPLNHPRREAQAFRMRGGVLLIGGYGQKGTSLPPEWLPDSPKLHEARWQIVSGAGLEGSAFTQASDTQLIGFHASSLRRYTLRTSPASPPALYSEGISATPRYIYDGRGTGSTAPVVQLGLANDGRMIVTGGQIREHQIAEMSDDANDPETPDHYHEFGERVPARQFAAFTPATQAWQMSAPAPVDAGCWAVLASGEVACVVPSQFINDNNDHGTYTEIPGTFWLSSNDGQNWHQLGGDKAPSIWLKDNARAFVVQNELLLSGVDHVHRAKLEWFNTITQRWVTLWESPKDANWRENNGRFIIRHLDNGKTLIIPVNGL